MGTTIRALTDRAVARGDVAQDRLAREDEPACDQGGVVARTGDVGADGVAERGLGEAVPGVAEALGDREVVGEGRFEAGEAADRRQRLSPDGVEHPVDRERGGEGEGRDVGQQAAGVDEGGDEARPEVGEADVVGEAVGEADARPIEEREAAFQAVIRQAGVVVENAKNPAARDGGTGDQLDRLGVAPVVGGGRRRGDERDGAVGVVGDQVAADAQALGVVLIHEPEPFARVAAAGAEGGGEAVVEGGVAAEDRLDDADEGLGRFVVGRGDGLVEELADAPPLPAALGQPEEGEGEVEAREEGGGGAPGAAIPGIEIPG